MIEVDTYKATGWSWSLKMEIQIKDLAQQVLANAKKKDTSSSVLVDLFAPNAQSLEPNAFTLLGIFFWIFLMRSLPSPCSTTLHISSSRLSVLILKKTNLCWVSFHHCKVLQSLDNSFKLRFSKYPKEYHMSYGKILYR